MARGTTDAPLTTRAARTKLAKRSEPHWRGIEAGVAVGYRKGARGGAWLARVLLDGKYRESRLGRADDALPANGADVLEFRQAQAKAIAWAAQQQRVAAGMEPEPQAKSRASYTVAEALADYIEQLRGRGSRGVAETEGKARTHILPTLGELQVGRLSREKVRAWHQRIAASPARRRGKAGETVYAPKAAAPDTDAIRRRQATANRVLTVLKAALNQAREEGRVQCAPDAWQLVKPFRGADAPKVRYLSDDEARRLTNASAPDFRELVTAALLTGCRYGELAELRARDFDERSATLHIRRSKSARGRHVFLADEGRTFFAGLAIGKAGDDLLFMQTVVVKQATKAAPAITARAPWRQSDQFRAMREACAAAGITPAASFHILRHTHASRLAMQGVAMSVIAVQLGHSDSRMTERHYAHLAPSYVADMVRAAFGPMGLLPSDGPVSRLRRAN